MKTKTSLIKAACYTANASMSVTATLSPLLFLGFRQLYNLSFLSLGALVFINFITQLIVDLVLSFYSHRFKMSVLIKAMPALTALGLGVYAAAPLIFPHSVYPGLVLGTVIFAASSGLAEVLISPVIAALPTQNPEREMSRLHSIYAWGVVVVVILSTLYLRAFGRENWQGLALLWMAVPLLSFSLFIKAELPSLSSPKQASKVLKLFQTRDFLVCFFCIFVGGASECTMAQWASSYLEQALGIPKVWGDILGVAMFSVMLGTGRSLYAKRGTNIHRTLIVSAMGASVCYLIAVLSGSALIGLIACALTGLFTAMLWPGNLLVAAARFPASGVAIFALMAAGGDLGGALGPQMVGAVTDFALTSAPVFNIAAYFHMPIEQMAMKIGLLSAVIFPISAVILLRLNFKIDKRSAV